MWNLQLNMSVNADAQVRPAAAWLLGLGRRLLLRYALSPDYAI